MSHASCRSAKGQGVEARLLIERGKEVLRAEVQAIGSLIERLGVDFARAANLLLACRGAVVVTGMGKAGLVGRKLAASLSSTGTASFFLHPADAAHGDLGSVRGSDIVILLSYSGETAEVTRLLPVIRETAAATIAITSHARSTLAAGADVTLPLGVQQEAGSLGLAPSCSTAAMLALGDALALVVSEQRGFTREQFARFHPGGSLGKQLTKVEEVMRPLQDCRVALQTQTVRQVLIHVGRPGRRTGAIMLCDEAGKLCGIFTDSDLARVLEASHESKLDLPIAEIMTSRFRTVSHDCYLPEAMRLLAKHKISELPVVTDDFRPLGILDITDVMSVISDVWSKTDGASQSTRMRILPISQDLDAGLIASLPGAGSDQ